MVLEILWWLLAPSGDVNPITSGAFVLPFIIGVVLLVLTWFCALALGNHGIIFSIVAIFLAFSLFVCSLFGRAGGMAPMFAGEPICFLILLIPTVKFALQSGKPTLKQ